MQDTSTRYNQIIASPNHWFESKIWVQKISDLNSGYEYTQDSIFSISTSCSAFADNVPQVGCAVAAELDLTFLPRTTHKIPPMAKIILYIRACNDTLTSEWIKKGIFWIDTREISHNDDGLDVMKVHGYDSMLKFDQMYPSDDTHDYPLLDTTMLQFVADSVGVSIDQRTLDVMDRNFTFSLPAGYTMREMLGYIGSAYGGNFVISDEGKLLLVQLGGLRTETYYLVDEGGDAITFGGIRILV